MPAPLEDDPPADDPLAQLEKWGRAVERRVKRRHLISRLRTRHSGYTLFRAGLVLLILAGGGFILVKWHELQPISDGSGPTVTATTGATDPFAQTPAASFPAGDAGLVMPAARTIGAWSSPVVAADLAKVRAALVATHLDHRMLIDHDPSRFISLLTSGERSFVSGAMNMGIYRTTAIQIADSAQLSALAPRVSGRTTYAVTTVNHLATLEVVTNYVWVYAFDVPAGWPGPSVVVVHGRERWDFAAPGFKDAGSRGMILGTVEGYWTLLDCAESALGFVAPGRAPVDMASVADLFRPDHPVTSGAPCNGAATRTTVA